jgi:hypothetical protein
MKTVKIFCVFTVESGSAFGACADDGTQVYIPPTVARSADLKVGDAVIADLIPNVHHPERTPWFAVHIVRSADADLDSKVHKVVIDVPVYITTAEVADAVGITSRAANATLNRLFKAGRISKADVFDVHGQSRPSFCLWSASARNFIEAEE